MVPSHLFCTSCGAANQAQDAFCFACGRPLRADIPSPQYPVTGSAIITSTGFLTPNLLLKHRYRIVTQVGKGGFSSVYKAEDIQFGNRVLAVKEMSQHGLSQKEIDEAAQAFEREALLLARLKHPYLPSIYDHFNEAERWYLVMDFIEGNTLEEHLNAALGGYLSFEEALQIGIQLCSVLGYLHTRQPSIIFRDLKPANIMLTPDGHLYLIDFGIARHFKPGQAKDTAAFGSVGYAAAEQYGKAQTTPRSDIYSLGATLHQMLTGDDPSDTPFQFAPLRLHGQPIPFGLETLIMKMVEMDESKRPASMVEIKQNLQRIVTQQAARQISTPIRSAPISFVPLSSPLPLPQTSISGASQKNEKQQWLDTGKDLYNKKRYLDALNAFEQALQHDPDDASIYNLKGEVLSDLKRYEEALTAYERAIQLDPAFALAHGNKGATLKNLQRYEEALAANERAIQLDSTVALAYNSKGGILLALNRFQEALTAYERAIQLDPTLASAFSNKSVTLMHLKRYEEALAACDQAILLNPTSAAASCNKGSALSTLKRYEEAIAAYDQAIRLDPNLATAYSNKGGLLSNLKRYEEALAACDQAIRLDPNLAEAYSNKGIILCSLNRYQEALTVLDQALQLDPNLVDASNLKEKILDTHKRLEQVQEIILRLKEVQEKIPRLEEVLPPKQKLALDYNTRGKQFSNSMKYLQALTAYETAIQLDPNLAIAYYNMGHVLERLGRSKEAMQAYDRAKLLGYSR
jgi:tetratricopeptide (TPR) repeat protein